MSVQRPFLSYENRTVLVLCLSGGIAGIDMLALNFLSPFVAADLHLRTSQLGLIGSAQLTSWAVASIAVGLLSDRTGRRKPFLVGALIAFALLSAASAAVQSFAALLAARVLVGLAEGPVIPMQNTIMLAASSDRRRGLNIGLVQNFGSQLMGALAGPLVLVWIAVHLGGWRNAFLLAGVPALAMAAIVHLAVREPPLPARPAPAENASVRRMVAAVARVHNIRFCFLVGVCAIAWYGATLTFVPLWSVRVLHLPPSAMSLVMGSIGAAGATAAILVPGLADRIGRRPAMAGAALCGAILPLGLLFGPHGAAAVCALVFCGSLFMGIFPLFIGVVPMESVDARQAATALALVMGCAQVLGGLIGPLAGGIMADHWSMRAPLWMQCFLALGAAAFAACTRETLTARRMGELSAPTCAGG